MCDPHKRDGPSLLSSRCTLSVQTGFGVEAGCSGSLSRLTTGSASTFALWSNPLDHSLSSLTARGYPESAPRICMIHLILGAELPSSSPTPARGRQNVKYVQVFQPHGFQRTTPNKLVALLTWDYVDPLSPFKGVASFSANAPYHVGQLCSRPVPDSQNGLDMWSSGHIHDLMTVEGQIKILRRAYMQTSNIRGDELSTSGPGKARGVTRFGEQTPHAQNCGVRWLVWCDARSDLICTILLMNSRTGSVSPPRSYSLVLLSAATF
ncbi:hypothetical protein BDN72DRAFT_861279 [Pluteus cervinus]|uniref:Uncharacterized protein n=1 Tax=Pluteus cervinus TaxID=181527 RepID=A0ACD3AFZ1_9AGAR|nr:hypothetical protein BDN72DRAFT_861279 [Pluteus cervinus]